MPIFCYFTHVLHKVNQIPAVYEDTNVTYTMYNFDNAYGDKDYALS